jgi:hypothetical protein
MVTDLDLAPPSKMVDGLMAVPVDIQQVDARLVFDGASSSGTGTASVQFVMGATDGNPIFDLRQTITAATLDGVPIAVSKLAAHDFGVGTDAQLRIVESVLAAGSAHTLRVTYTLGPPQASTAGSYLPAMTWSAGPRLAFNFGFTDLGAGRYLEAWVPANLIYDRFVLNLDLQVVGTAVGHTPITNGAVTALGFNHWSVAFPARFTALSPLLELRATDTLVSMTDTVTLPVSGITVTVEAWKLATSTADLGAQIANLKLWLAANEQSSGTYLHGSRFVAFVHVGGMEYEGGTTSSVGALRHETFHSWFARGLKPASQPDGWWDEAWTVYNDHGAVGSAPFDFTDPPVELHPQNPWVRVTAPGAYTDGLRFFEGAAAAMSVATLRSLMRDLYLERRDRPITTMDLEQHLVCRSGRSELVDAFHRFVYGFDDPSPAPDLWIKDDPTHTGTEGWGGPFWDSPDLWIRNHDDGGTTHQPVEYGQDNWFHARVRNRGQTVARHFLVTFNVLAFAGVEFRFPDDFLPAVTAAAGFDLAPGASTVVKARWPADRVPPPGTHACWLAAVLTRLDAPVAGRHVWEHNNLAQKNLAVVDLRPGAWFLLPFVVNRFSSERRPVALELRRPEGFERIEVDLHHPSGAALQGLSFDVVAIPVENGSHDQDDQLDCGGGPPTGDALAFPGSGPMSLSTIRRFRTSARARFKPGPRATIRLRSGAGQIALGLGVRVPKDAKPGSTIRLDLVRRADQEEQALGGLAIEIGVREANGSPRTLAEGDGRTMRGPVPR